MFNTMNEKINKISVQIQAEKFKKALTLIKKIDVGYCLTSFKLYQFH